MKKYNVLSSVLMGILMILSFNIVVFANSSWHWLTDVTPFYILPIAVIFTIVAEVLFISKQIEAGNTGKTMFFVLVANMVSFIIPYLLGYSQAKMVVDTFDQYLHKGPTYMIGFAYLILTLVSEVPIVYNALKKKVENKDKLLKFVFVSNVVTTVVVAILERVFCRGSW